MRALRSRLEILRSHADINSPYQAISILTRKYTNSGITVLVEPTFKPYNGRNSMEICNKVFT